MSPSFETVLEQANALSAADRRRLEKTLKESNGHRRTAKNGTDDEAIAALSAWVDEMEKTENPKRNSSAKIAERIRRRNDRGHTL